MKNHAKIIKKNIITAMVAVAGVAAANAVIAAPDTASALVDTPWGPERTTFTWADPAPYATFNSITDNPGLGDERNFVRIREVSDGTKFGDEVTLEAGKTYEVYIYYHNNADAHDVGKTAVGIAENTYMQSTFPSIVRAGEKATINATISSTSTNPVAVWDGAYATAPEDLYLRYVPGTAIIHNGGELDGSNIAPDYLFGNGALLGYNQFSGILPGCNEYAGYVTYQVFADAPGFEFEKTIISDTNDFKVGDEVTFKLHYENTGTMDQENVVMRDSLPEGLEYVAGSTVLYNNNYPNGESVNDDIVTEQGINIGNYAGGSGWAEVTYRAVVKDANSCAHPLTNSAIVSTTDGNKTADVTINIEGEDCEPLPDEIVSTGPVEIIMAIVVVLGICGGAFYLYRTRRTLKTVENEVSGAEPKDSKSTTATPASGEKSSEPSNAKDSSREGTKES